VTVDEKCECGPKNGSVVGKFECAVSECECGEVECGVLSVTVPYLGNAPEFTAIRGFSEVLGWRSIPAF